MTEISLESALENIYGGEQEFVDKFRQIHDNIELDGKIGKGRTIHRESLSEVYEISDHVDGTSKKRLCNKKLAKYLDSYIDTEKNYKKNYTKFSRYELATFQALVDDKVVDENSLPRRARSTSARIKQIENVNADKTRRKKNERVADLENENRELKSKVAVLQGDFRKLKNENRELTSKVATLERNIRELKQYVQDVFSGSELTGARLVTTSTEGAGASDDSPPSDFYDDSNDSDDADGNDSYDSDSNDSETSMQYFSLGRHVVPTLGSSRGRQKRPDATPTEVTGAPGDYSDSDSLGRVAGTPYLDDDDGYDSDASTATVPFGEVEGNEFEAQCELDEPDGGNYTPLSQYGRGFQSSIESNRNVSVEKEIFHLFSGSGRT